MNDPMATFFEQASILAIPLLDQIPAVAKALYLNTTERLSEWDAQHPYMRYIFCALAGLTCVLYGIHQNREYLASLKRQFPQYTSFGKKVTPATVETPVHKAPQPFLPKLNTPVPGPHFGHYLNTNNALRARQVTPVTTNEPSVPATPTTLRTTPDYAKLKTQAPETFATLQKMGMLDEHGTPTKKMVEKEQQRRMKRGLAQPKWTPTRSTEYRGDVCEVHPDGGCDCLSE